MCKPPDVQVEVKFGKSTHMPPTGTEGRSQRWEASALTTKPTCFQESALNNYDVME